MASLLIRTVIMYAVVVILMRLTGKRQIGQLEIIELVTAFMISELALSPISDSSVPLLYGIMPCICLVSLEVILSFGAMKSRAFRRLLTGRSLMLVNKGRLDKNQMKKARITVEELICAARGNGILYISDIDYAFLEPNGTISVIPKVSKSPVSCEDMGIKAKDRGMEHSIITDGILSKKELKNAGLDEKKLRKLINKKGFSSEKEIFYMGINDAGEIYLMGKDDKA